MSQETTPQPDTTPDETNPDFTAEQHRITESMFEEFDERMRNEQLTRDPERLLGTATELMTFIQSEHYVPGPLGVGFRLVPDEDAEGSEGMPRMGRLKYELIFTGRAVDMPLLLDHFNEDSLVREAIMETSNNRMDAFLSNLVARLDETAPE